MTEIDMPTIEKEKKAEKKYDEDVTDVIKDKFVGAILIEDLRSEHVGQIVSITAILKDYSRVSPRTIKARFECPSCGSIISMLQLGDFMKEPSRCSCGRRANFELIDKDQVDFQMLTLREAEDGASDRIKRTIRVFLKEHLTVQELEKTLRLGKRINVIGKVVESSSEATVTSLSIEAQFFSVGIQKGDRELLDYIIDHFNISKIQAEFLIIVRNNFYNISKSCMKYGIAPKTHYRWLEGDSEYKESYDYIMEGKKDFLESEIIKKIKYSSDKISADMLKFYAKTKMGYVEKTAIEHSGKVDTKMEVEIIVIQKKEDEEEQPDVDDGQYDDPSPAKMVILEEG